MRFLPTDDDERFLSRALKLASEAVGLASPNPTVGCVLVRDGLILGEGAHCYDTFDHAEIVGLKQAAAMGHDVRGATAYVTLEPCSHHGRTGPCADALVVAGVARCVLATVDPNPLVRGKGITKLRAAGIVVDVAAWGPARELNDAFAFRVQHGRPFVTLKAALSVDGKLAPAGGARSVGAPYWLTGESARADVQVLRHGADAIVTGVGTIVADNPSLTDRTGLPRRRPLMRVILDGELRTPLDAVVVVSEPATTVIFCRAYASQEREAKLRALGVEVVRVADDSPRVDLGTVIAILGETAQCVLVEAGSAVNGSFLSAGLVDKVVLYFAEIELGVEALPFAEGFVSPYGLQETLQRVSREAFANGTGEDVRMSGYIHDPWADI